MSPAPHLPRHHHRAQRDETPQERPATPRDPPTGPALRLTVYVGEHDQCHHRPLYAEIVHLAHRAGLAGASAFRGLEGFGRTARIHTTRLLDLAEDLPIAVVVVDEEPRVRAFAAALRQVAPDALIALDRVEVVGPGAPAVDGPEAARDDAAPQPGPAAAHAPDGGRSTASDRSPDGPPTKGLGGDVPAGPEAGER